MTRGLWSIALVVLATAACDGGQAVTDAGADVSTDDVVADAGADVIELVDGSNVMSVIVNQGPFGNSTDEPFVSVTICVPGTSQCETIDNVLVDTGSMGLRIMSSAIKTLTLPAQTLAGDAGTETLTECEIFGSHYQWGSVRLADVQLGPETAPNVPVHIVGDPGFTAVPSECSSLGSPQLTPAALGANGLLGINVFAYDCGPQCAGSNPLSAFYYWCDATTTCTVASAALAQQIINPVARLPVDNNGVSLRFPAVPPEGAATLTGQIVFGIGTQPNNGLGNATIIKVDAYGNFTTIYGGKALGQSFIDTGTNKLAFPDNAIPHCSGQLAYLYCPTSPLALTATIRGTDNVTSEVAFDVANASQLFAQPYTAYDDLAGPGGSGTFDWGFPFFIGRAVYVAILNASTPGGKGPFVAW